ncbi:MAG: TIGR04076 family protein [Candidatus Helarchaeota archaeon]|nr:TIGR04076 family protein [Candidatus Helarchaeota archaeon]
MYLSEWNRLEIKVKEIKGTCPVHKLGDRIVIEGPFVKLDETDALCTHAFSCLSTFLVALREGIDPKALGLAKSSGDTAYYQCLDPGEPWTSGGTVLFEIKVKLMEAK